MKSRARKVVFAALVFLVVLELVLQAAALVIALTTAPRATAGGGGDEVLCVGDSYTFGLGALTPEGSYPGRLQAALTARGLQVTVVNAGIPGQNSREVLLGLSRHLKPRTKVVCVLLGANDGWTRPAPLGADEVAGLLRATEGTGFRLRWRTGRLLAIAFRFAWGSWRDTGASTVPASAVDTGETERNRAAGYTLLARLVPPTGPLREPVYGPASSAATSAKVAAVWQALGAQQPARAHELAADAANVDPEDANVLCLLALAARKLGRVAEAEAASAHLERLVAANPEVADVLLPVLWEAGRSQEALEVARRRAAQEPRSIAAWNHLQTAAFTLGLEDEFRRAAVEALWLWGTREPGQSATVAIRFARFDGKKDPMQGARWIVASMLLGGTPAWARLELQIASPQLTGEHVERALAESGVSDGSVANSLRELVAGKDTAKWGDVLRDNLTTIGHLAAEVGARTVIVSYPFATPEVEAAQGAAAQLLAAPYAFVRERFDQELKTRAREELFVADGHCNDAGYAIMAEIIAVRVAEELRR